MKTSALGGLTTVLVATFGGALALGSGCSSTTVVREITPDNDAAAPAVTPGDPPPAKTDGGTAKKDSGAGTKKDSGTTPPPPEECTPADVSTFQPAWRQPGRKAGACTDEQITAFYDACLGQGATQQSCAPFGPQGAANNRACAACIVTEGTAAELGPLVENSGLLQLNIAGCVALAEGKADGSGCGGKYNALSSCADTACDSCSITDDASLAKYQECAQAAETGGCQKFSQDAQCMGQLQGEAANCIGFQTFDDGYKALAKVFCGQ